MKRKRRIHYGRVLVCAGLLGALIFGIVKIVQASGEKPVPVTSVQTTIPDAIPVETIPPETETTESSETAEPTTEYIPAPESMQLEVPYISQEGILPTGCELISAMMLLRYYGVDASVSDIIDNTTFSYPVIKGGITYGYSPYQTFIGSPYDENSFGCYPPVIVEMLNKLLPEGKKAVDITGTALPEIAETYLPKGEPVLVWATINMMETDSRVGWYLLDADGNKTDEWYNWKANEHCLVLVGYDEECYYFNDPYEGNGLVGYDRELVETRYAEIGKCAVVVMGE